MKCWKLRLISLAALFAALLPAQDIAGTWQGTMPPRNGNQEQRIVFKISKAANDLTGLMFRLDENEQGLAIATGLSGAVVKISVPSIVGMYEGRLDSAGATLTGTWTQNGSSAPLTLKHVKEELAWPLPEASTRPARMATDADPVFGAVSIKPGDPGTDKGLGTPGGEFRARNVSVSLLLQWAYGVHARQIVGTLSWLESDNYDIVAKPDGKGVPLQRQWKVMVGKMLADRFQLKFHHEKRELPIYAIQVGKNGPKLVKSAGDPDGPPWLRFSKLGELPARNASMAEFANTMQTAVLDRPVMDQTGLAGRWDFLLTWTPEGNQFAAMGVTLRPPGGDTNPDAPPDLVTAMQNQLGLRLAATKGMVDVIVIDHVERPSAN